VIESLVTLLRLEQLWNPLSLLDIAILWLAIYQLLQLLRKTRAVQMAWGLLVVVGLWFATLPTGPLPLKAVHWVLGQLLYYGGFAVIVIFQGPIRQALARFGRNPFARFRTQEETGQRVIKEVALAASALASKRIGALVVLERTQGLRTLIETGIEMDAIVSYDLLMNIFTPKTPLHDGAVIISDGRIKAASCFLPLSTQPGISHEYGTRHRAAIGISEESDAIAIVVSEERGIISVAMEGGLHTDLDTRSLVAFLEEHYLGDKGEVLSFWQRLWRRGDRPREEAA